VFLACSAQSCRSFSLTQTNFWRSFLSRGTSWSGYQRRTCVAYLTTMNRRTLLKMRSPLSDTVIIPVLPSLLRVGTCGISASLAANAGHNFRARIHLEGHRSPKYCPYPYHSKASSYRAENSTYVLASFPVLQVWSWVASERGPFRWHALPVPAMPKPC